MMKAHVKFVQFSRENKILLFNVNSILFSILFIKILLKYTIVVRHPTALIFPKGLGYFLE